MSILVENFMAFRRVVRSAYRPHVAQRKERAFRVKFQPDTTDLKFGCFP
jgi:hypothetical protein